MKLAIKGGTCLLVPTTPAEKAVLSIWKENLKPGDRFVYEGRGENDGEFWTVKLQAANVGLTLIGDSEQCASLCEHKPEKGFTHNVDAGVELAIGWFCGKCGRGQPEPAATAP